MNSRKTSINCNRVDNCSLTMVLDKRTNKNTDEYPVCICFTINRKRYYHKVAELGYMNERYFGEVCNVSSPRSALLETYKKWQGILETYREKLVRLHKTQNLTIELIKASMSGADIHTDERSFISVWKGIIESMRRQDRVGTAENYQWALNSFLNIVGDVPGFNVDLNVMQKWNRGMKDGVVRNGETVGKIADATRGMYLRTCRVVWNECIRLGYIAEDKYPFSSKDKDLISIPRGSKRQQSYLSVAEMTELFNIFTDRRYPDTWSREYAVRAHQSLGLFLAQYLCNGCNLADLGRLTYDRTYFSEGGRALMFRRKKTAARSNGMSVVIVPVIEPLRTILAAIGAKPENGQRVFPQIFAGATDELTMRKLTVQENSNIKDRVIRICQEVLDWKKEPSGTWARHSFATNLKLAGVEELYISESMGHSQGNDVTAGYQDLYPLEIRFRNNAKLLNVKTADTLSDKDIDKMNSKQLREYLKLILQEKG